MAAAMISAAHADELIMPFACTMEGGIPKVSPSTNNNYRVLGQRQELPFSSCGPSPNGVCETMMVHQFVIECDGERVSWAKVAQAARHAGVEMPANLPDGFAPVSLLHARFVLPALARSQSPVYSRVAMQDLSPDSVVDRNDAPARVETARWVTVIDPERNFEVSSGAFKAASILGVLTLLIGASLALTRQWPAHLARGGSGAALAGAIGAFFKRSFENWQEAVASGDDANDAISDALSLVHMRLAETELVVATLPQSLLLRDVLLSEIDGLRAKGADLSRRAKRLGRERAIAGSRALLRDLDRISRIAHGAMQTGADHAGASDADTPVSEFDAYRVLGLNADAPPIAVKKVVDALRMTWHPDRARDEADRVLREKRIKQINAAWDILKMHPGQAAAA